MSKAKKKKDPYNGWIFQIEGEVPVKKIPRKLLSALFDRQRGTFEFIRTERKPELEGQEHQFAWLD